ncbi:MAG TPA: TonB-dependent receptor [Candidatus Eremiobacteraceae bacterium]
MFNSFARYTAFCLAAASLVALATPAFAADDGAITGTVINETSGAPINGAKVELLASGGTRTTNTDAQGKFAFSALAAGSYEVRASAAQYVAYDTAPFALAASQHFDLAVFLQPASGSSISTLGHVVATGQRVLNHSSAATDVLSNQAFVNQGLPQVQNGLEKIPGITIEHHNNGAPGNVASLTIRGAGGFVGGSNTGYEVLVLQDGQPMRNGQYGDFDLSATTPAIYSHVEVVKGLGGTSLFGANTIGGTLNLVTRDPQSTPGGEVIYSIGGFGTQDVNLAGTDTIGRLGYLIDLHHYGTDGYIPPSYRVDYSGTVSIPSLYFGLRSGMAKFKYAMSPTTSGVLTFSDESDIRDQTGLLSDPNGGNGPSGFPSFFGFPGNYVTNIQPKYSFDLYSLIGGGSLELRAYHQWIARVVDGENAATPASGCCFIQLSDDRLTGLSGLWSKDFGNNTFAIGAGGNGDYFNYGSLGGGSFIPTTKITFSPADCRNSGNCQATQIEKTILVRDDDAVSQKFDLTFAGYYSNYNTLNVKRFDPRFAIVNKPNSDTVLRLSLATGFAAPRLSDIQAYLNTSHFSATQFGGCPMSEPQCAASAGNPNVKAETAAGIDLGYEHIFGNGGDFNIDLYRTNLHDHIFSGFTAAPPGTPTFDNGNPILFLEQPINLAGTVYTGVETSATVPLSDRFSFDPYYNIQAAYPTDVPLFTQQALGNVVDNQQYQSVPVHKYGWGFDYHTLSRATSITVGADYYAKNNSLNVKPFWVYNSSLNMPIGDDMLHVGWVNMFNTNAGLWETFNGGVPYPGPPGCTANGGSFGPCAAGNLFLTNAFQRAPHMLTVTLDRRWGSLLH